MIKTNITSNYPNQNRSCTHTDKSIFIADYTEKTKSLIPKRGVEIFIGTPPTDIDFFSLVNSVSLNINKIVFDNSSFVYPDGTARSQCECVIFPCTSNINSWILFVELKYSCKKCNNRNNLQKAIRQLYKTRSYYFQKGIFSIKNPCYLIASLPMQTEPFANFSLTPAKMQTLKRKHNVILRLKNAVSITDKETISV